MPRKCVSLPQLRLLYAFKHLHIRTPRSTIIACRHYCIHVGDHTRRPHDANCVNRQWSVRVDASLAPPGSTLLRPSHRCYQLRVILTYYKIGDTVWCIPVHRSAQAVLRTSCAHESLLFRFTSTPLSLRKRQPHKLVLRHKGGRTCSAYNVCVIRASLLKPTLKNSRVLS